MPTDAEWYDYLNHYDDDDLCVTCREEEADPDSLEGECLFCMEEDGDE
jgi:hypothetical protein